MDRDIWIPLECGRTTGVPHERDLYVPIITREEPVAIEKDSEVLLSRRDEVFFHGSVSRKITNSLLDLERVLHTLAETQEVPDIPVSTREEHRGSCHNSRGAPLPSSQLEMRVPFPASWGKNSRHSCRISRRGALHRKVERNSMGRATIPKDAQRSQSTPEEPHFPALPRLSP